MIIPAQGFYQPHPRSARMHLCPHIAACTRDAGTLANLQAMQCANRAFIEPAAIDPRPYTALQCAPGYAGPLCSACFRPGRNTWLPGYMRQAAATRAASPGGYSVASQPAVLTAPWRIDPSADYGRTAGRCAHCPHPAVAWIGFLLARLLDMAFVGLLAMLWCARALASMPD